MYGIDAERGSYQDLLQVGQSDLTQCKTIVLAQQFDICIERFTDITRSLRSIVPSTYKAAIIVSKTSGSKCATTSSIATAE